VIEVRDGVFAYVQPDGSWCINNTGFLVGRTQVVSIDATSTERRTRALLDAIASVSALPVTTLVNTHAHLDHTNGNCFFGPVAIVAHERCRAELLEAPLPTAGRPPFPQVDWGTLEKAPPTVTFSDTLTLWVDDLRCELRWVGEPAHTTNDITVWLPERSVLFAGDLVFNGGTPFHLGGSIPGARRALEWIRALGPEVIVPGHGDPCGVEVVDDLLAYLDLVWERAIEGRAAGMAPLDVARQLDLGEFGRWLDPERIVGNLHRAYAELEGVPPGEPLGTAPLAEMVEYNGGRPLRCLA